MMNTPVDDGAISAYAPLRRNSFLEHPRLPTTTLSRRLSTLTLGLTLVILRCWKDARLELLPVEWQRLITAYLQKWRHGSALKISTLARRLVEQLAPFVETLSSQSSSLSSRSPLFISMVTSGAGPPGQGKQTAAKGGNKPNSSRANTSTGRSSNSNGDGEDAPTSILCDGSSTQFTQQHWSVVGDHNYEDRIRQNQALIRRVLHYWFGQYDPDTAQKKLWMIAHSAGAHRATVDSEIAELFTPLLCELAAAEGLDSDDHEQLLNHDNLQQLYQPTANRWMQWCADKDMYGYQGKLAAIIVLDQFSRHIRRHYEETSSNSNSQTLPAQSDLDNLALRTAQLLTKAHEQEIQCGMIPLPQYVFGLMPYRHANTLASVQYVQTCVEKAASLNLQLEDMTSRFRKATNRRMAVLQDEARRTGQATTVTDDGAATADDAGATSTTDNETAADIESASDAPSPRVFSDEEILETFPFEADMSEAAAHPVVRTIQAFLADRGIRPIASKRSKESKSDNQHHQQQQEPAEKQHATSCSLIVSLSGGVDSMVIASVLAFLKSDLNFPHLEVVAIHIDYANRPESKAEAEYVERYCNQHGIRFVVRRIEEVTRGITARDEYEQRARQVRYDMYRNTAAQESARQNDENLVVGVVLGHHRGDLRENVLSNAHKGCGPLDLSGMTAVSQNDGVTIYRPLLPLEKKAVYDYAHRFGVPYFKDTTPHWSTRGKLRNKLLPLLEEIYGEGSMNNLSTLATESDECRSLLHDVLLKPFMDRVVRTPMGIVFETAPFIERGEFFWKFVLREVLHSAGLGMFSDKSVLSFLERVNPKQTIRKTIREGWLQCRKDYAVFLQQDGRVYVFYPDSFPWRKADGFKCFGQSLNVVQRNFAVGPWTVSAELVQVDETEKEGLLKRKAVPSMDQFMTGYLEYYLEVPNTGNASDRDKPSLAPLVFTESFQKTTRPLAWKSTDDRIQDTLPLLGIAESSRCLAKDLVANPQSSIVRVSLDRR